MQLLVQSFTYNGPAFRKQKMMITIDSAFGKGNAFKRSAVESIKGIGGSNKIKRSPLEGHLGMGSKKSPIG